MEDIDVESRIIKAKTDFPQQDHYVVKSDDDLKVDHGGFTKSDNNAQSSSL